MLTTHLHLVPRLRTSIARHLFPHVPTLNHIVKITWGNTKLASERADKLFTNYTDSYQRSVGNSVKVYIKYLKQAYDITDSNKLLEITNWNTYKVNKTVISNNGRTKAPVKILIIYLTDYFEVTSGLKH